MKRAALPNTRVTTEAEVVKECVEYLHRLGWRPKRNHVGLFYTKDGTPIPIGTPGEPDWTFTHPEKPAIWIEFKRPGKEPSQVQHEFIAKLKYFGYKAGWCDSVCEFLCLVDGWDL